MNFYVTLKCNVSDTLCEVYLSNLYVALQKRCSNDTLLAG